MVKVEQALDRGVDAGQISELKLRTEQQLQSDAVDRLHPDLGAEAFEKDIALDLCAGCHGLNGDGIPNTVVAMRGNTMLRLADPRNLIVSMLDGIPAQNFPHLQSMQAMPGFADKLSDQQAADLANYLRVSFGGQSGDVTPAAVRTLR
jgi:mono/diheme cytochrome c family protein